jgi:hypothetical protein
LTEVPATEFARNFGRYSEVAQREAVAVKAHDRITGYFISAHEYEEHQRLKAMTPACSTDQAGRNTRLIVGTAPSVTSS